MFSTSIILVDDDRKYLDQLNRAFAISGLSCLPIHFDKNNPENKTGIDHITFDTKHTRIIALDINLRESPDTQNAKTLYPIIEEVLKKLNPSGPYYLMFWSRYKDLPDEIIKLLAERSKDIVTAPIGWGYLDKSNFTDPIELNRMKDELKKLVSEVCIFSLLREWEDRTSRAASLTLSELYKIASKPNGNGWDLAETNKKLITLLTHIAHESVGRKNSGDAANYAVETGLLPILKDNLRSMTSEDEGTRLNNEWADCLVNLGDISGLEDLSEEDVSSLNTFYNLEEVLDPFSKSKRGVFVQLSDKVLKEPKLFTSVFGKENSVKKLITEEFLFNTGVGNKQFREDARQNIQLGWLEIGAICDHAQMKNRLHRYLLSALVPLEYLEMVCKQRDSGTSRKAHDGIYRSPILLYKDNQYILLSSFRYSTGLHEHSNILNKPLFRLKEHIINEIAFSWSKHAIRLGITSF